MTDGISSEPVIAPLPTPVSVEPRVASPVEAAEIARQSEEAKVAAAERIKGEPKKAAEPAPKDETKPKLSAREAIRAAAAKVHAEPASPLKADPNPKAVEPAPAPKADTAKDAPKGTEPTAPVRGEDGKFVSTKAAEPAPVVKAAEPVAKPATLPSHTAEPPPARFSPAAKEKWAEAPDEVRAEVTRAVTELTKGFEKHRAAAERDASLAEFHEMAGKSQKQLRDVVAQYVGMENLLRADPIKGLELIAKNAGLNLRDVAAKIAGQAPDAAASAADARVIALEAQNAELQKKVDGILGERAQQRTDTTTERVTKFAAEHPRFEELADDIAFFLKSGKTKDLAEAYTLAERLNPAPAAAAHAPEPVVASSAAPAIAKPTLVPSATQTRDAGTRSIAGTPTAGSDPVRKQPSNSVKEAIRRAASLAG